MSEIDLCPGHASEKESLKDEWDTNVYLYRNAKLARASMGVEGCGANVCASISRYPHYTQQASIPVRPVGCSEDAF